ncbi:Translation initiation factor eIF-2B subunit epsilon isoform 2 [Schistosoma japonicum]|uniref:Translation initiation factor eIF2B subunit epsilon n=2 Tax=Schistosoma japonicum TaxID=6182 RepID=A0A4Z2D5M8_SCHJA|nr:Translation initiation factor eIF-2B subunit epsilon isoform 2 [Schistosoma japonicum]
MYKSKVNKTKVKYVEDSVMKSTSSSFGQTDKGLYAVLVADLLYDRFDPLSEYIPPCLLPLSNVPLLHMTLSTLASDGFKNILIYAIRSYKYVQAYISQANLSNCFPGLKIFVQNVEKCHNIGDVMRDLETSEFLCGVSDFLLAPADLICGTSLAKYVHKHKVRREKTPNAILSLLLPPITEAISPVQASEFKVNVIFSRTSDNRLINLLHDSHGDFSPILLSDLVKPNEVIESSQLMDIQLAICSNHIPPLFQDNFDYETMDDLVSGVLTNEEIMEYTIHIEPLPKGPLVLQAAPDLSSFMDLNFQLLSRQGGFLMSLPPLYANPSAEIIAVGPQVFVAKSAKIHRKVRIIGACFIGPGCEVSANACLIDCILGDNCFIGENTCLRRVIALENVHISSHVKADVAWLCSGVRILSGFKLSNHCFIGPSSTAAVTLGPGSGNLPSNSVLVAPRMGDLILDSSIGGEQIWATYYKKRQLSGTSDSMDNLSEEDRQSNDMYLTNNKSMSCRLWETAWDRIKSAAKTRRQKMNRKSSHSRTSDVRSSKSSKPRRMVSEIDDTDLESQVRGTPRIESDADDEQSESFIITELKRTLERGERHKYPAETLILEVNSLKHAYNVPIEDFGFLLIKALLELTRDHLSPKSQNECIKADITEFIINFRKLLLNFNTVLSSCMSGLKNTGRIYLQAVEDAACYDSVTFSSSMSIIHALYDNDLVLEDDIWWWKDNSPLLLDGDILEKTTSLREKIKPFLNWLEEAEEEDDN